MLLNALRRWLCAPAPRAAKAYGIRGALLIERARAAHALAAQKARADASEVNRLYREAIENLERAEQLDAASGRTVVNLGIALREAGELDAAHSAFQRAADAHPDDPGAACELAFSWLCMGESGRAAAIYRRLIERHPGHVLAHGGLALCLLGDGDFEHGWDEYEWRLEAPDRASARAFPFPFWRGESLIGRTLLVRSEQGIGDEIMFASCLPDLIAAAGHCIVECSRRLAALFRRSFPQTLVIERDLGRAPDWHKLPPIDFQIMGGSVPRYFRRSRDRFPGKPYLRADPQAVAQWRHRGGVAAGEHLVGLAWTGGLPTTLRAARSIPLAQLAPLLRVHGARFMSLELHDPAGEIAALGGPERARIAHSNGIGADLDELAAVVAAMDLVICVPTAAAHVAGALGVPVWVVVPRVATWRYLWKGEAMPWYASMRVLRRAPERAGEKLSDGLCRELERFLAR